MGAMLDQLKRRLRGRASPLLKLALVLRDPMQHPHPISVAATRRVVVLAPHMDDEAIGCGGAVLQHVAAGARVVVVFLTDGRAGDRRLYDPKVSERERREIRSWLYDTRCTEARQWCEGAGVADLHFLDAPDGRLGDAEVLARSAVVLGKLLQLEQPEVIYLPSPLDTHQDHVASNRLLQLSWPSNSPTSVCVRGYEVWSPTAANAVCDITDVWSRKRDLLLGYQSQLHDVDYVRAVEGLNAYRAMLLPARTGYAEAYLQLSAAEHGRCLDTAG